MMVGGWCGRWPKQHGTIRGTAGAGNKRGQLAVSRPRLSRTRLGHRPQQVFPATCTLGRQAMTHGGNNTQAGALKAHVSTTAPAHKQVIHRPGANHNSQPSTSTGARACPALTPTQHSDAAHKHSLGHRKVAFQIGVLPKTRRLQHTRNTQASAAAVHTNIALNATAKRNLQQKTHNTWAAPCSTAGALMQAV